MRVAPGTLIPFWFKLWDGNPNRFVGAHLTSEAGTELPNSPYPLTYSGNRGIYAGVGPTMTDTPVYVDYETFFDEAMTQTDVHYLGDGDRIEPDTGSAGSIKIVYVTLPLRGVIKTGVVLGTVKADPVIQTVLNPNQLKATVRAIPRLIGTITIPVVDGQL